MSITSVAPASSGMAAVTARISAIRSQFAAPSTFRQTLEAASAAAPAAAGLAESATSTSSPFGVSTRNMIAQLATVPASTSSAQAAATSGVRVVGAAGADLEQKVVARAREFLGVPYVWGAEQRDAVDCSGLMLQIFNKFGIDLPRVSADQATAGREVSRDQLRPGDMVFFDYSSARAGVDHVGIYIGEGKMIHAPRPGDVVKVSDVDFDAFVTARRVLPADAGSTAAAAGGRAVGAVRGVDVTHLPAAGREWAPEIAAAARRANVDPALLTALVWSESGFDANAKSPAGALGLGQLMPATAAGLGVNPYRPEENLAGAAKYLAEQIDRFGDPKLALAAYNAGPGAVSKYGGIPPYTETRNYVSTVMDRFAMLRSAS